MNMRQRIADALEASIDQCARCKVCDIQAGAVMAVLEAEGFRPEGTRTMPSQVYWEQVTVDSVHAVVGGSAGRVLYKAWKAGFPGLVGYGATLEDAIAAMMNKFGE